MGDISNCLFKSRRDQEGGVKAQGVTRYVGVFVDFLVQKEPWKTDILGRWRTFHGYKCEVHQKGLSENLICASGHFLLENRVEWKISTL